MFFNLKFGLFSLDLDLLRYLTTLPLSQARGNPRCKNITAKNVHLTSLYPTALTSTNDHLSVLRHYVCTYCKIMQHLGVKQGSALPLDVCQRMSDVPGGLSQKFTKNISYTKSRIT